ncbi:Crp/Fnr family transcriptional regulator [Clostridiaceae bacterium OttesenSCG-928-D20]|nr:Crp/Fnr family transcriptional regulator [Clostridiaceae bacterium OttesenSCG-928-D20]
MQLDMKQLQSIPLFENIKPEDFAALFACMNVQRESYDKGEFISLDGDTLSRIGIVLSGRVQLIKEDIFGNRAILSEMQTGEVFGESFVCGGSFVLTASFQAAENTNVLFLSFDKVMTLCESACDYHAALIKNMVVTIARSNIRLLEKLVVTTKHSLREKILTYLSQLAEKQGGLTVTSPLGRADMADFFGADRSALSRELKRMKDEGLIDFEKNTFSLKRQADQLA